jgi:hypothetical protein
MRARLRQSAVTKLYRNLSHVGSVLGSYEVPMRINKILSLSVVILLITVVFAGAVPATAQYDTMQFRYNAQHTGDYSPVRHPQT